METTATTTAKKDRKPRTSKKAATPKVITPEQPTQVVEIEEEKKEQKLVVFFEGPFSDCGENSKDGVEKPYWSVSLGTDLDAEPKYAYKVWYYVKAKSLAERIATDQKTEIISMATTAR